MSGWIVRVAVPRGGEVVRPTYRCSAASARGSEATDKPVSCNALLGGPSQGDALPLTLAVLDDHLFEFVTRKFQ